VPFGNSVNKEIVVRLKWGETEYKGRLVSIDSYMNIQLTNAQEYIDQKFTSDLGQILIRYVDGGNLGLWKDSGVREANACVYADATTCYGSRARTRPMMQTARETSRWRAKA
jgi:small nuclear ribonucleoprotein (snRNP)-like protein